MSNEKKINEIQTEYKQTNDDALPDFIDQYIKDGRPGVAKIIVQAQKKLEKNRVELERVEGMKVFEKKYSMYNNICGIDEVGRGPLAGPVCAAAVILPPDCIIMHINDSKKLSEKRREELYDEIMNKAISVGVSLVEPDVIDEVNILQATYIAMRQAISKLSYKPELLLNDAVTIPDVDIKQVGIIKGDAKSQSIAAASIIAKVTRDRIMVTYDKKYPGYGFAQNKGYGTKEHIAALKELGATEIHRRSFIGNFV